MLRVGKVLRGEAELAVEAGVGTHADNCWREDQLGVHASLDGGVRVRELGKRVCVKRVGQSR